MGYAMSDQSNGNSRSKRSIKYVRPSGRSSEDAIEQQVSTALGSPVVDTLMRLFGSIVAVLNEHRQILAVNVTLLRLLGVEDTAAIIGLRPGEALHCVHAWDSPDGCGMGETCRSCGAALALAAREVKDEPVEEECVLTVDQGDDPKDLDFRVTALPLQTEETRLTVLIMEDISIDKRRAALERTFFHDVNNMIASLVGASQLLGTGKTGQYKGELVDNIRKASIRLAREISIQRQLMQADQGRYEPSIHPQKLAEEIADLQDLFRHHPTASDKTIDWPETPDDLELCTDSNLLTRVLTNALLNALEATDPGGRVALDIEIDDNDAVSFLIHNDKPIPPDVVGRIFQRYYTTKPGSGRGLGTYAMKLFTERYLEGEVSFTTSQAEGTTFRIRLPREIKTHA